MAGLVRQDGLDRVDRKDVQEGQVLKDELVPQVLVDGRDLKVLADFPDLLVQKVVKVAQVVQEALA